MSPMKAGLSLELERHLMEMGVVAQTPMQELEAIADSRLECLAKGYYNDPRDENGEVPF